MNFRDRARRPFSWAAELRVLAVGLFAVAGGALLLSRSRPVAPSEVAGAALVVVLTAVLSIAAGLRRTRREPAEAVER